MIDSITDAIAEWREHGTPGPWEMTRTDHLDGTAEMMFSNRARDKLGKEWLSAAWFDFARTWIRQRGASEDYPTGKANARLIAAAPEMAAHIEEMESIIVDLIGSTEMPWAEAVGRAESFLYAKNEKGECQ